PRASLRDARRPEREVHDRDRDEHDHRDEDVVDTRLRGAPAVRVELPLRALAELPLHGAQQLLIVALLRRRRRHGERAFEERLQRRILFLVFFSLVAHPIFSPSSRSTISLSCARARKILLFTVPAGRPVISPI